MMNYPGTVGRGHKRSHPRRQIIFLVTPEQEQRINDAARERGMTRANLIRESLEMVLTLGHKTSEKHSEAVDKRGVFVLK